MTVNARRMGFEAYAGVRPSPPALARFPTVVHPSCSFLRCCLVAIRTVVVIPVYLPVSVAIYYRYAFREGN
jgi:hypothetical protein